jgi:hypothetical protein
MISSVTDISTLTELFMQQAVMLSTISRGCAMSFAIEPLSKLAQPHPRNVEQSQGLVAFAPSQAMVSLDSSNTIVGLGPLNTQVGDVIAFLYGLSVPAILRPVRNFNGLECYRFIGEAYVHGRMDSEIFDTDHVETTFRLMNGAQDRRLLGPPDTRVSDIVEVTYDHSTPATLRPIKGASGMQRYRYFGDEYVNGRVGGENSSGFQVA